MRKAMLLFHDWLPDFEELTAEEVGKLVTAALKYDIDGTETEFKDRTLRIYFRQMQRQCDSNREKYEARCQKNKANAMMRWDANGCDRMRSDAMAANNKKNNKKNNNYINRTDNNYKDVELKIFNK